MGNAGARMRAKSKRGVVRVMKVDGKTLEFHAPVLVKDLLTSHPNCYVGAFKKATQPLPPNYKLRIGLEYYLLPASVGSTSFERLDDCNARRVKVVITKQLLQRLMARQAGVVDVLLEGSKLGFMIADPSGSRVMDTIPGGVELVSGW